MIEGFSRWQALRSQPLGSTVLLILFPAIAVAKPQPGSETYFVPPNAQWKASSSNHDPLSMTGVETANPRNGINGLTMNVFAAAPRASQPSTLSVSEGMGRVGPFAIEQHDGSPIGLERGTTVTAAYPIKAMPGTDLVVNMFGGHRESHTGSNAASAAMTAGVRIKW